MFWKKNYLGLHFIAATVWPTSAACFPMYDIFLMATTSFVAAFRAYETNQVIQTQTKSIKTSQQNAHNKPLRNFHDRFLWDQRRVSQDRPCRTNAKRQDLSSFQAWPRRASWSGETRWNHRRIWQQCNKYSSTRIRWSILQEFVNNAPTDDRFGYSCKNVGQRLKSKILFVCTAENCIEKSQHTFERSSKPTFIPSLPVPAFYDRELRRRRQPSGNRSNLIGRALLGLFGKLNCLILMARITKFDVWLARVVADNYERKITQCSARREAKWGVSKLISTIKGHQLL